jgi:hypothetical protein
LGVSIPIFSVLIRGGCPPAEFTDVEPESLRLISGS